jgi:hypothetical protein
VDAHRVQCDVDEMSMKKENWPELVALTSIFSVELPGIEPAALPGKMPSDLTVRYVSFRFNTARYLRIPIQVLTASRAVSSFCVRLVEPCWKASWASIRRFNRCLWSLGLHLFRPLRSRPP